MAYSPEYRSLTICVGELKRSLRKRENNATLNDLLKRFVRCSSDQLVSTRDHVKEEEHGRGSEESHQALVHLMLKLVQQHPHKYHEFLQDLKDVPSLSLLHRSLSQAYCELIFVFLWKSILCISIYRELITWRSTSGACMSSTDTVVQKKTLPLMGGTDCENKGHLVTPTEIP